jgi:hypothetical protein
MCSDRASFMTGRILSLDGGFLAAQILRPEEIARDAIEYLLKTEDFLGSFCQNMC